MKAKKTATKKAAKKVVVAKKNLLFDKFRPSSMDARFLELMIDGKARTSAEISRTVKPKSKANEARRFFALRKFGVESKLFDLTKTEDGKILLTATKRALKVFENAA